MKDTRIQKALADMGLCSRRQAEQIILEGRVKLNGHPVKLGDKMDMHEDVLSVDGRTIRPPKKKEYKYYMLHKPRGYITTSSDDRGRKTVMELIKDNFLDAFIKEITSPVDDKKEDHSYEYVATQVIAEYIRSLGYDGICFNSSVGRGKSYVFFCGPNMEYSSDGYDYIDEYLWDTYPKLTYFTDWFDIQKLEYNYVFQDGVKYRVEKKIVLKDE